MSEMKTFVFTDIVRSVDLKGQMSGRNDAERDEAFVSTILTPHRERIEHALEEHGGRVVSTAGDGHFLVFANTIKAASWAVQVQQRHREEPVATPTGEAVAVRMSLHVGFPQADPNDPSNFIGRVVDYAARLNDYASSGQILISSAALGLLKDAGLDGIAFHAQGARELKGIGSVEVHELLYGGGDPKPTRNQPADTNRREWTVLPATMGLTEYAKQGSSGGVVAPVAPARRLGNYELGELLGSGGMGAVYRARHTQFDRDRAVKVIKPHLLPHGTEKDATHEDIIRRFYREIKAMGALDHPNIVVAIDSSAPTDDTHYLVMEYVDGVGADALVQQHGPLPVAAACEVARQAAVGLEYLHRKGLVHRDIKPSNLMLTLVDRSTLPGFVLADAADASSPAAASLAAATQAPVVKILDLGLALLVADDQPRLTQLGHGAMGTAMYMSPEQWSTTSVDIRSDIYSLGCTLFHLISGRPPFFDSDLRPQRAHERAPVPEEFGRDGFPKPLAGVVKKMMAKRPEDRFASPSKVAEALAELADAQELGEAVARGRRAAAHAKTRPGGGGETLADAGPAVETQTLGGAGATSAPLSWQPPAVPKPAWRRWLTPVAIFAAVAASLWLGSIARQQRESLRQQQRDSLKGFAGLAASLLADEIGNRFEVLKQARRDAALRDAMRAVDPADRSTWRAAQAWIERRKQDADPRVPASSWFLVAPNGTQIARAKPSRSIGKSYAERDYFNGQAGQLVADEPIRPIRAPHQSSVYRSTSTKELKVAFSTPVWAGPDDVGEPIGVLGMSVGLGKFRVFEEVEALPDTLEVVLVDLRLDDVGIDPPGDAARRGLLLHHPELADYEDPQRPFRLPAALLTQIDSATRKRSQSLRDPIIDGYGDLLARPSRGPYTGAFQPVIDSTSEGQRNSQWLVIVQEEAE
ncbi:MAG: protein kinase [Planctomycetota bacterium]